MKTFLYSNLLIIMLLNLGYVQASEPEEQATPLEKLAKCPPSPNCINTEFPDDKKHFLPPVPLSNIESFNIEVAITVIKDMGGVITERSDLRVKASFTTRFLKYVDDFEVRLDPLSKQLHIRSASREGYYDFGVNKRRTERFLARLSDKLTNLSQMLNISYI